MKTAELLTKLEQLGVQLRLDGKQLSCHAPKGILTPELRSLLVQQKKELMALLSSHRQKVSDSTLPEIVAAPEQRHLPFPLTEIQQAYWLGRNGAFELGNVGNHLYVEIDCEQLDLERLNAAWQKVIDRHDMLRAVITWSYDACSLERGLVISEDQLSADVQQQILKQVPPYQIEVDDLRGQKPEARVQHLQEIRDRLSHQLLPPEQWPPFEIRACRLNEQCTRLFVSLELLNLDVTSVTTIFREWFQLYENPKASFKPLEFSFRDYIIATQRLQKTEAYQRSLNYWKHRLTKLPPAPELSFARNPSIFTQPKFNCPKIKLDAATWQKLKNRAIQKGLSPSGVLLGAYAEVLTTWSKTSRFTINVTLFNRMLLHPGINDITGDFTSLILLEVDNSEQNTFEDRVKRIQKQLWNDLDHCHISGVHVLRELSRLQEKGKGAIMPVIFTSALNHNNDGIFQWLSKFGSITYTITQTPQVWLDFQAHEHEGSLITAWATVEGLFPEGLLDDMLNAYEYLLQQLADEESSWQQETFQLIPQAQLEQRSAINSTEAPVTNYMLQTLFAEQVPQRSQQAAVVATNRTLSYEELYNRSNQVGHWLRQMGVRPNTLVAVVMEKGWEQVVAVLGILQAGAAYLPIAPGLPKERLWHLLEQGEVEIVLTQSWLNKNLVWPKGIQRLTVDNTNLEEIDYSPLEPVQKPEDLAYVIFTSGSTGLPKGVMIDHRGAVNTILDINQRFNVKPTDRVLALSSLSFDLSVYDIFGTLAAGGIIVIPDASATRDPAHWIELIVREQVTIWNSVPALMEMLVEYVTGKPELFPSSLRLVLLSGDWLPLTLPDRLKAMTEGVEVISLGGATEASIWSILYTIEAVDLNWKSIPYGKPMVNQRFYVLNDWLEACPTWVIGQLYIGGIGLAKGYWRDETKTKNSFIYHPRTGERLYRTGDLGRFLPDGNIEFLGRQDFQVKIRGYRIELGEIETALQQHPGIRAAVAVAVGESSNNKQLVAYFVPKPGQSPTTHELRDFLQQKLPDYMMPAAFVMLESLMLTPNGKLDRKSLPIPDQTSSELKKSFTAPRDSLELQLAQLWEEVLGIQSVSVKDNFFDLGGNSLLAVRLMARTHQISGKNLPLSLLFEAGDIERIANVIRQQSELNFWSAAVAIRPGNCSSKQPFFFVHPIGGNVICYKELARHLEPNQPFYGLQSRGLDGNQEPFTRIEAMATYYIQEIQPIQPKGPYLLGGWSMGAKVAFEIAQQLLAQGERVDLLVLLDEGAVTRVEKYVEEDDTAYLMRLFAQDLIGLWGEDLPLLKYYLEQNFSGEQLTNALQAELGPLQIHNLLKVFENNFRAWQSYTPRTYPGQIILFKANEQSTISDDALWGWSSLAKNGVEIHVVPGNHYTMIRQPYVQILAERLREILQECKAIV
jgi:amino acid adenylation domain-containing protein